MAVWRQLDQQRSPCPMPSPHSFSSSFPPSTLHQDLLRLIPFSPPSFAHPTRLLPSHHRIVLESSQTHHHHHGHALSAALPRLLPSSLAHLSLLTHSLLPNCPGFLQPSHQSTPYHRKKGCLSQEGTLISPHQARTRQSLRPAPATGARSLSPPQIDDDTLSLSLPLPTQPMPTPHAHS